MNNQIQKAADYLTSVYSGLPVPINFEMELEFKINTVMYDILVTIDKTIADAMNANKDGSELLHKLYAVQTGDDSFIISNKEFNTMEEDEPTKCNNCIADEVLADLEIIDRAVSLIMRLETHVNSCNSPLLTPDKSVLTKYITKIEETFLKLVLE